MTSLLLAENNSKTDIFKYTQSAKLQPEYSINTNLKSMKIGETMTADDVMKALMLYSANDMSYMLADNVCGDYHQFVDLMNKKATDLGLKNTHFTSPNGLHNDDHYTTPYELSIFGMAAYENPWVKEVIGTPSAVITTSDNKPMSIENSNKLLGIDGCVGGKTGYTDEAGRCLVAFFNRNGRELVGVVTHSLYDANDTFVFEDMKKIIDYSYNLKKTTLYTAGQTIDTYAVKYRPLGFIGFTKTINIPIKVSDDIKYYNNDINVKEMKTDIKLSDINVWKLNKDTEIGTLTLDQRKAKPVYKLVTTVTYGTIIKDNILIYAGILVVILLLLVFIFVVIHNLHKGSKRRNYY